MALPTTPATQSAGVAIASATLNNHRDNLNFLLAVPVGRLHFTTQPAIASATTYTVLAWDTEDYDLDGAHAANASSILPVTAGYYEIMGAVVFPASNTTGTRRGAIFVNGTAIAGSMLNDPTPTATAVAIIPVTYQGYFNGTTDFFDVRAQQSSGGSLSLLGSTPMASFVHWHWMHN